MEPRPQRPVRLAPFGDHGRLREGLFQPGKDLPPKSMVPSCSGSFFTRDPAMSTRKPSQPMDSQKAMTFFISARVAWGPGASMLCCQLSAGFKSRNSGQADGRRSSPHRLRPARRSHGWCSCPSECARHHGPDIAVRVGVLFLPYRIPGTRDAPPPCGRGQVQQDQHSPLVGLGKKVFQVLVGAVPGGYRVIIRHVVACVQEGRGEARGSATGRCSPTPGCSPDGE